MERAARSETSSGVPSPGATPDWTFLSNHSHVLVCVTRDPEIRVSEVARRVGIGERAVHRILTDLEEAGYLTRTREGRRNRYSVHLDRPLRHPLEAAHRLADVFGPLTGPTG
jgi:DNA-binding transcriptional ArsR family regulator